MFCFCARGGQTKAGNLNSKLSIFIQSSEWGGDQKVNFYGFQVRPINLALLKLRQYIQIRRVSDLCKRPSVVTAKIGIRNSSCFF
jgi:hypothetical protein